MRNAKQSWKRPANLRTLTWALNSNATLRDLRFESASSRLDQLRASYSIDIKGMPKYARSNSNDDRASE